jgi:hypothetical protein
MEMMPEGWVYQIIFLHSLKELGFLCFQRMNSSGEREFPGEVYLSKLILPQSSALDSGYYTCLAINQKGFQYRGAYLTVLSHTPEGKKLGFSVKLGIFHIWNAISMNIKHN